jgi:predicted metal-dependent phosphoesterase TrpH
MVAKGFAGSVGEVFERWIGPGCPAFVKRYKLTPTDAIEIIRSAGGLAFLAHAGLLNRGLTVADCLLSQGLDGIEVFHTEHSQEQVEGFLQYVRERDIYLSGGSDCHGNPRHMLMGSVRVDAQLVEPWLI